MNDNAIQDLRSRLDRLERQNRRLRWVLTGVLIGVSVVGLAGARRAESRRPDAPEVDAARIAQERVALARSALRRIEQSNQRGAPVADQPGQITLWSRRMLFSRLFLTFPADGPRTEDPEVYLATFDAAASEERVDAFKDHWEQMKLWEAKMSGLMKSGVLSPLEFQEFQDHRLQAEQWLAREQAKDRVTVQTAPPS